MKHSYLGAVHIHSNYSDGAKDIDYIIKKAQRAKLRWIIITDHNDLSSIKHEGFYGDLCVIAGLEVTPPTGNHLLAFGINQVINENIGARNYVDEVHKQGGICFPAHPDESISRDNEQKPLRWDDWSIDSFDGLEIWNYLTDWTDAYSSHKNQIVQYISRHKMAKGPTRNLIAWWDRLNLVQSKIVPAIGGIDAHAFDFKKRGIKVRISDYYDYFCSLNNRILLNEPLSKTFEIAKQQIISALKNGNNSLVNRRVSKNTDFEFYVADKDNKFFSGETCTLGKYSYINLSISKKATIRLFHNGLLIYETTGKLLNYDKLDIGKYRIEVYDKDMPWIFTNPIEIIGDKNASNDRIVAD